jgi:hypothetical protein
MPPDLTDKPAQPKPRVFKKMTGRHSSGSFGSASSLEEIYGAAAIRKMQKVQITQKIKAKPRAVKA